MSRKNVSRREFTAGSVMAMLAGVTVTLSGCGGGSSPSSPTPTPNPTPTPAPSSDKAGAVSANHGHVATVTAAQITGAALVSLDITGTSNHPHTLELTAAEVQQIGAGTRVAKNCSTNSGHDHAVTFN